MKLDLFSLVTEGAELAAKAISRVANIEKWIARHSNTIREAKMDKGKQSLKLWASINYSRASNQSLGEDRKSAARRKSKQTLDFSSEIPYHKNKGAQSGESFSCGKTSLTGTQQKKSKLDIKAVLLVKLDLFSLVTEGAELAAKAISRVANIEKWIARHSNTIRPSKVALVGA